MLLPCPGLGDIFGDLLQPRYRRPLSIGLSLMLFQQITGQPSATTVTLTNTGTAAVIANVLFFYPHSIFGVAAAAAGALPSAAGR